MPAAGAAAGVPAAQGPGGAEERAQQEPRAAGDLQGGLQLVLGRGPWADTWAEVDVPGVGRVRVAV